MAASSHSYYMQFLRCDKCLHAFECEDTSYHPITLPKCGHTMCKKCILTICNETQCPRDRISFGMNYTPIDQLPINYPLLIILDDQSKLPKDKEERYGQCRSYMNLDEEKKSKFKRVEEYFDEISVMIKPIEYQSIFSHSTIRKIFSLLKSQYIDSECRLNVLKVARSLGEHICIDVILQYQNFQQLKNNFHSAIGLQDDIQEEVLRSISSYFGQNPESFDTELTHSVSVNVAGPNPYGVKPIITYIVDLLCLTSCFEVEQYGNSSSKKLKRNLKDYKDLRGAYDRKIIQMAMEADK